MGPGYPRSPARSGCSTRQLRANGGKLLERLRARPGDESDWTALRQAFDVVAERYADADQRARGATVQQIVEAGPVLLSAFLEKQRRPAEELQVRALARGPGAASDAVVMRAVVGAAFACLQAVVSEAAHAADPSDLGACLDMVMAAVQPMCFARGR